jgi:uncharacterized protein (TIGR02453 family)
MAREKILPFLKKLKNNNHKEWFDQNRPEYEQARESFIELIAQIIQKLGKTDHTIESADARKAIFRINRDVRFSKNKMPYKLNMAAAISEGGRKSPKAGYYLHLEPSNCFIGGGVWMPEPEVLKKIRQEIDYNGADLDKILQTKKFRELFGGLDQSDKLIRTPKDFEADHPYADYLKLKSFFVVHSFDDKLITEKDFPEYCAKVLAAVHPLNEFLNVIFD